jgi:hypothetical protein
MLYEKLTLDQFETALKNSDFTATKSDIIKIRDRVFKKLVFSTMRLALDDALRDHTIKSGEELKFSFTLDNVFEETVGNKNENFSRVDSKNEHFNKYHITIKTLDEVTNFDEAA